MCDSARVLSAVASSHLEVPPHAKNARPEDISDLAFLMPDQHLPC